MCPIYDASCNQLIFVGGWTESNIATTKQDIQAVVQGLCWKIADRKHCPPSQLCILKTRLRYFEFTSNTLQNR